MYCPVCTNTKLAITDRQGIEIDYCPDCRGVWLDRGELDKIIERSATDVEPAPQPSRDDSGKRDRGHEQSHSGHHGKRKRKGMLGELFDF